MSYIIQAVIWDLDGVIIDSADEHRRAWQRLAREEGIVMTDADFWAPLVCATITFSHSSGATYLLKK